MPYLFDASALVELIPKGDTDAAAIASGHALDLTFYETANTFWKAWRVRRSIDFASAEKNIKALEALKRMMTVHQVENIDLVSLLQIARETGLTIYDSAYVAAANENSLDLVTVDEKMKRGAKGIVTVVSPAHLSSPLGR